MSWETNPFEPSDDGVILRNKAGVTRKDELGALEFVHVRANMKKALSMLQFEREITMTSWLRCHAILFSDLYPWAGQIRHVGVDKGPVRFNFPKDIVNETNAILRKANDPDFFASNMGKVYATLAFNHPFLDGNGRSLNTTFTELARRSGFGIAWDEVKKEAYLATLTHGIVLMEYEPLNRYLNDLKVPLEHYEPGNRLTKAHTPI
jgi:cell filamentation protein